MRLVDRLPQERTLTPEKGLLTRNFCRQNQTSWSNVFKELRLHQKVRTNPNMWVQLKSNFVLTTKALPDVLVFS